MLGSQSSGLAEQLGSQLVDRSIVLQLTASCGHHDRVRSARAVALSLTQLDQHICCNTVGKSASLLYSAVSVLVAGVLLVCRHVQMPGSTTFIPSPAGTSGRFHFATALMLEAPRLVAYLSGKLTSCMIAAPLQACEILGFETAVLMALADASTSG